MEAPSLSLSRYKKTRPTKKSEKEHANGEKIQPVYVIVTRRRGLWTIRYTKRVITQPARHNMHFAKHPYFNIAG